MQGFGAGRIRTPWFPWQQMAPIDLQWEKYKKIFFSKTIRPRAFINPANRAPGVHTGPAPGA